jgi:hypothetical protein
MSREKEKIEADILKAERRQEEALKAGREALAVDIQKQILVLQGHLENERERINSPEQHLRSLEIVKAQHKG